jgi:protocatechuate 3,4-dioxygenase alpha subunit
MTAATAFQTIGPFWHLIDHPEFADLTRFGAQGERVILTGRLTDGDGAAMPGACVELWQASPAASDTFPAWGRANTDESGVFRFTTIKPGPVPGNGNTLQAPHFALTILARGILTRLYTRAYFAGDAHNDHDPLLGMIEDPARRATLLAHPQSNGEWRMDIRVQGEGETVFLEL